MGFIAKCNLRINRETILKGTELDSVPKGFEQYFEKKSGSKKTVKRSSKEVETSSIASHAEKRAKKND